MSTYEAFIAELCDRFAELAPVLGGATSDSRIADLQLDSLALLELLDVVSATMDGEVLAELSLGDLHNRSIHAAVRDGMGPEPRLDPTLEPHGVRRGRVRLLPVEEQHYRFLYQLAHVEAGAWPWRGLAPSPEAFRETLWSGVLCQYVVADSVEDRLCGLVSAYSANFHHGWAYVRVCAAPEYVGRGVALEGVVLLVEHLFRRYAFRKLYAECSASSLDRFRSGAGAAFVEEARLAEHLRRGDGFEDAVTISVTRSAWDDWCRRFSVLVD